MVCHKENDLNYSYYWPGVIDSFHYSPGIASNEAHTRTSPLILRFATNAYTIHAVITFTTTMYHMLPSHGTYRLPIDRYTHTPPHRRENPIHSSIYTHHRWLFFLFPHCGSSLMFTFLQSLPRMITLSARAVISCFCVNSKPACLSIQFRMRLVCLSNLSLVSLR